MASSTVKNTWGVERAAMHLDVFVRVLAKKPAELNIGNVWNVDSTIQQHVYVLRLFNKSIQPNGYPSMRRIRTVTS